MSLQNPPEQTKFIRQAFFPLETRHPQLAEGCDHDLRDKQKELDYIIPWKGKRKEADTQIYSCEDADKGSGTALLPVWPQSPSC